MKSDDRNAIIVLVILLMLVQRGSGATLDFKTGLTKEDLQNGAKQVVVGGVAYAALRMASKLKWGRFVPVTTPIGALIAATSIALFVYPWVKKKITGTGNEGGTDPLPCGIKDSVMCGDAGVERWGVTTVGTTRYLTVVCKNGSVNTSKLTENCK